MALSCCRWEEKWSATDTGRLNVEAGRRGRSFLGVSSQQGMLENEMKGVSRGVRVSEGVLEVLDGVDQRIGV